MTNIIISLPDAKQQSAQKSQGFYTVDEAARIARVPRRVVTKWRRDGIVVPKILWINEDGNEELGYTFEGVTYLRLLRMFREIGISLRTAVYALHDLRTRFGPPGPDWEQARIFSYLGKIYVHSTDEWETTTGVQKAADILFGEEFAQLRDRADALLVPKRFQKHVQVDPEVRDGLPTVRNSSIPTSVIHVLRQRGQTFKQIHQHYPALSLSQIKGADDFERFLDAEAA